MTKNNSLEIVPLHKLHEPGQKEVFAEKVSELLTNLNLLSHLDDRNLLGAVEQFRQPEKVVNHRIRLTYEEYRNGNLGMFALVASKTGKVEGVGTVNAKPIMRRHRFDLPVPIFSSKLVSELPVPGPRVSAWVVPQDSEREDKYLIKAYKELANPHGVAFKLFESFQNNYSDSKQSNQPVAYTIEPNSSPAWIHKSIQAAGFFEVDRQKYTESTSRLALPISARYSIAPQA
ncbi:MAG: hypothetical protein JWO69_1888 [Thermoleophilia bacterium]|nr:hypothetical protein [Thermoleophilia bacterium]